VAKAEFFVAKRHGRVNVWAELNAGRTSSVRGLQFVPALDARSAFIADSCFNAELPVNDRSWDIGLILRPCVGFRQLGASAVGAARRERHVVRFINLLRNASAMMLAMILAALASGLLRIGFALLAKGGRLAFAFAFDFLESCLQRGDLSPQLLDDRLLALDDRLLLLKQCLAIWAVGGNSGCVHIARHCGQTTRLSPAAVFDPVNKY
jgi:hypothetical protein